MAENTRISCARREEIISSAREVFMEYGYKKTTLDDVAARLNITRSALYYYYRNKDDLFLAIMEDTFRDYREQAGKMVAGEKTIPGGLEVYCGYFVSHRDRFFRMYKFSDDDYPVAFDLHRRIRTMSIELQSSIILDILRKDEKLSRSPDLQNYSILLTKSLRGIVHSALYVNLEEMKHDMVQLCRIFYSGLKEIMG